MRPIKSVDWVSMENQNYRIEVWPGDIGQLKLQLIFCPHGTHGFGTVVRELITYEIDTMRHVTSKLMESTNPEACVESMARPWNIVGNCIWLDQKEIKS